MMKRKQQVLHDDNVTVYGSNKRSLTAGEEETDYFGTIDLIIKILSKLSVKPMAKCRCVSKLWSSIIRRPNYNQLFPNKSPPTPRLLLAVKYEGELFFYSSSQPQNPDKNSSLVITHHHTHSEAYVHKVCSNVGGLVCSQHIGKDYTLAVITNPITGETLTTPKVKRSKLEVKFYFGFDPIEKQFKVLCVCNTVSPYEQNEYQVLTLGTGIGSLVWRKIQSGIPCYDLSDDNGICINGVLYMKAKKRMIVCFDVKSEKFSFINISRGLEYLNLIDYKGKLGAIKYMSDYHRSVLLVLEDAGEHKWSEHSYKMPKISRICLNPKYFVSFAGIIGSGEIVLYQKWAPHRFFFGCYNLEKNTIATVRLGIPKLEWFKCGRIHTFTNFVEDVKLM